MSKKQIDQVITIGPLPKGAAPQEVHVNPPGGLPPGGLPPGGLPPHYAAGTERLGVLALIIILAVAAAVVISACGIASALTAGAIR